MRLSGLVQEVWLPPRQGNRHVESEATYGGTPPSENRDPSRHIFTRRTFITSIRWGDTFTYRLSFFIYIRFFRSILH